MKKTTKPNPLKTFNDNNAMAYKKAGGAMDAFKKSLRKAPDGVIVDKMPILPAGKATLPLFNANNDTYYDRRTGILRSPGEPYEGVPTITKKKIMNVPEGQPYSDEGKPYDPGTMIPKQKKGGSVKRKKK